MTTQKITIKNGSALTLKQHPRICITPEIVDNDDGIIVTKDMMGALGGLLFTKVTAEINTATIDLCRYFWELLENKKEEMLKGLSKKQKRKVAYSTWSSSAFEVCGEGWMDKDTQTLHPLVFEQVVRPAACDVKHTEKVTHLITGQTWEGVHALPDSWVRVYDWHSHHSMGVTPSAKDISDEKFKDCLHAIYGGFRKEKDGTLKYQIGVAVVADQVRYTKVWAPKKDGTVEVRDLDLDDFFDTTYKHDVTYHPEVLNRIHLEAPEGWGESHKDASGDKESPLSLWRGLEAGGQYNRYGTPAGYEGYTPYGFGREDREYGGYGVDRSSWSGTPSFYSFRSDMDYGDMFKELRIQSSLHNEHITSVSSTVDALLAVRKGIKFLKEHGEGHKCLRDIVVQALADTKFLDV